MDRAGFAAWLERYVDAWRLNDALAIGDLFSADVRYAFDPFDEAVVGRAAVVAVVAGRLRTIRGRGRRTTRSSRSMATCSSPTAARAT